MASTLAVASAVTKIGYQDLHEQLDKRIVALQMVKSGSKSITFGGKEAQFAIHTGRNQGVGARNEDEDLPEAGQNRDAVAHLFLKYQYGSISGSGSDSTNSGSGSTNSGSGSTASTTGGGGGGGAATGSGTRTRGAGASSCCLRSAITASLASRSTCRMQSSSWSRCWVISRAGSGGSIARSCPTSAVRAFS